MESLPRQRPSRDRGLPPLGQGGNENRGTLPTRGQSRGVFGEITNLPNRGVGGGGGTPGGLSYRGHLDQSMGNQSGFHQDGGMGDSRFGNTGFSFAADKENISDQKKPYTKNLTAGLIRLNIQGDDRLAQEYVQQDDNEIAGYFLNKKTSDIGTLMEILKTGKFKPYTGKRQEYKEREKENLELILLRNIHAIERYLIKFFLWIQGLVAGICLLHLYLVFSSDNEQHLLETNSNIAKTISQVLNILTMFSLVGMMVMTLRERLKYDFDPSPINKRRKLISYLSLGFFLVVYLSTLVNIPFVNTWNFNNTRYPQWYSDNQADPYKIVYTSSFSDDLTSWKYAAMARGVAAVSGWMVLTTLIDWDNFDDARVRQFLGYDPNAEVQSRLIH